MTFCIIKGTLVTDNIGRKQIKNHETSLFSIHLNTVLSIGVPRTWRSACFPIKTVDVQIHSKCALPANRLILSSILYKILQNIRLASNISSGANWKRKQKYKGIN